MFLFVTDETDEVEQVSEKASQEVVAVVTRSVTTAQLKETLSFTSLLTRGFWGHIKSSQSNPEDTDQNQALLLLQCNLHQSLTFQKAWFSLVVCTSKISSGNPRTPLKERHVSYHCQAEHDMRDLRTSRYHTMLIAGWESKQREGRSDLSQNSESCVQKWYRHGLRSHKTLRSHSRVQIQH